MVVIVGARPPATRLQLWLNVYQGSAATSRPWSQGPARREPASEWGGSAFARVPAIKGEQVWDQARALWSPGGGRSVGGHGVLGLGSQDYERHGDFRAVKTFQSSARLLRSRNGVQGFFRRLHDWENAPER